MEGKVYLKGLLGASWRCSGSLHHVLDTTALCNCYKLIIASINHNTKDVKPYNPAISRCKCTFTTGSQWELILGSSSGSRDGSNDFESTTFFGTLPETNIFAPKNGWLEYYFPIWEAYFQVRTVSFREGNIFGNLRFREGLFLVTFLGNVGGTT